MTTATLPPLGRVTVEDPEGKDRVSPERTVTVVDEPVRGILVVVPSRCVMTAGDEIVTGVSAETYNELPAAAKTVPPTGTGVVFTVPPLTIEPPHTFLTGVGAVYAFIGTAATGERDRLNCTSLGSMELRMRYEVRTRMSPMSAFPIRSFASPFALGLMPAATYCVPPMTSITTARAPALATRSLMAPVR